MKELIVHDSGNWSQDAIIFPTDDFPDWTVAEFMEFMATPPPDREEEGYLPFPENEFLHMRYRRLFLEPVQTLNRAVRLYQNDRFLTEDDRIDLSQDVNHLELKRHRGRSVRPDKLALARCHREDYAACKDLIDPIFDFILRFDQLELPGISSFSDLAGGGFRELSHEDRIILLYQAASSLHYAPFENASKLITDIPFRSGPEMWQNLAAGFGGICAEKALALKFFCDLVGYPNTPVFGTAYELDPKFEEQIAAFARNEGREPLGFWLQHHLLRVRVDDTEILVDCTNGNLPFLFLTGEDLKNRINGGIRVRLVYSVERLNLYDASNQAGDTMLVESLYHLPKTHFDLSMKQRLGLHTDRNVHIGVFHDWDDEQSRIMRSYYAGAAKKSGLPQPMFFHGENLNAIQEDSLIELLEKTLDSLHCCHDNYSGDFTFVIQPLTPDRWQFPHISDELAAVIQEKLPISA